MDSYQLGKDIQSLHDKLDVLTSKKCGCSGDTDSLSAGKVKISLYVLRDVIEQLHYLASAVAGKEFGTGQAVSYTWDTFLAKYNPEGRFDWCCRCDDSFGNRSCHNLNAISKADALANCAALYCLSGDSSVTGGKCGPSDHCS
jgi:hypothetical protein